jgi:hypothetical protein
MLLAVIPLLALSFLASAWYVLWSHLLLFTLGTELYYVEMLLVTLRTRSEWESGVRGWVQVMDVPSFLGVTLVVLIPRTRSHGVVCSQCLLDINELWIR